MVVPSFYFGLGCSQITISCQNLMQSKTLTSSCVELNPKLIILNGHEKCTFFSLQICRESLYLYTLAVPTISILKRRKQDKKVNNSCKLQKFCFVSTCFVSISRTDLQNVRFDHVKCSSRDSKFDCTFAARVEMQIL